MSEFALTTKEKERLLSIARSIITQMAGEREERGGRQGRKKLDVADIDSSEKNLNKKAGAFVSIHKKGRLRGCIGRFEAVDPLYKAVMDMAHSASQNDSRFPRVSPDEVEELDIEISVLSPLRKIKDVSEIEVGTHGIYIIRGMKRGTLLPQVAVNQGWDRDKFLEHTCIKAGLNRDAWKDRKTEIYIYDALVFGEGERG